MVNLDECAEQYRYSLALYLTTISENSNIMIVYRYIISQFYVKNIVDVLNACHKSIIYD